MMVPYPDQFPRDALAMALDLARGNAPELKTAVHACWVVAGYALGQTLGGGPTITCDNDAIDDALVLEQAIALGNEPSAVQGIFPWLSVLAVVLRLLEKYAR